MTHRNANRARRLARSLQHYGNNGGDLHDLIDLLTDARHWCDHHGEDYAQLDRIAHEHYLFERTEPRGGAQ